MNEQPTTAYAPLYRATDDTGHTPTVDTALSVARDYLNEVAAANIHDHGAMVKTAAGGENRRRR